MSNSYVVTGGSYVVTGGSYVVTGGGRGIGRAVAERLLRGGGSVVVIELDPGAVSWVGDHPAAARLAAVTGSAAGPRAPS